MAAGGEQTWSAHACDVSLGARMDIHNCTVSKYVCSIMDNNTVEPV